MADGPGTGGRDAMPLFAAARRTDPETSHLAAVAVEISGTARLQRRRCLDGVREHPGVTAAELAAFLAMERHAPSRRLPELRQAGLVRNGNPRICSVVHRPSMTWWAT